MILAMKVSIPTEQQRLQELAAFLRTRRERLLPADVGLSAGFRRRTPGLRREEVALLAGVGTTWYTWLEQGRQVRPSVEVLSALADALKLAPAERRHLFLLSDRQPPEPDSSGPEIVPEPILRMLSSMAGQPAYVLGRRWDVLAWNRAAEVVFGDYSRLEGDKRNIMYLVFVDPAHRRLIVDWNELASSALAMFRADSARYTGDQDFERLITMLKSTSVEFRTWWVKHDILEPFTGHKCINHPKVKRMVFEFTNLFILGQSNLKLVVYTPLETEGTIGKLNALLKTRDSMPSLITT